MESISHVQFYGINYNHIVVHIFSPSTSTSHVLVDYLHVLFGKGSTQVLFSFKTLNCL